MTPDLSIDYLGLRLKNPIVAGASPLPNNLDTVRRIEDAGAAAITLYSLFEEQIRAEQLAEECFVEAYSESFGEALSYFPDPADAGPGPDHYLEKIRAIKRAVDIPLVASLNGVTDGGWIRHASLIEQAGADALELNFYFLPTSPDLTAHKVETQLIDIVMAVRGAVKIPVAIKLSPFFSALPNLALQLVDAGANGMVLFNRFYQPDIDTENLEVVPALKLSDPSELLLRLRWLAILSAAVPSSYACSGGVHSALDAVKAVMAGASAVQIVSRALLDGPEAYGTIARGFCTWLEENEYESARQLRGSMNHKNCPDPSGFERANYLRVLQGWSVADARWT
jgi:dihydroorotate dehydrogenase (fumarate)